MAVHNGCGYGNSFASSNGGGCPTSSLGYGGWQFNPMFGMFTYLPFNGFGYSPYGLGWWSPATIGYFTPSSGYFGGGGIATASKASPVGAAASGRVNASAPFSSGGFASRSGGGMASGGRVSSGGGGGMSGGGGGMSAGGGGGHAGGGGHK